MEDIKTFFEEEEEKEEEGWVQERWWYKLAQVCRRWRYLILEFASHLDVCLHCTYGTPVADILAHSPPLPLIIDYLYKGPGITAKEEDIFLALQHRDRVRRISLRMPVANLRRFVIAIDDEFPMLDYLYIGDLTGDNTGLMLPETFQAPQLRHLLLEGVACPMGSPLITTGAAGLVILMLNPVPSSAYFSPNDLLLGLTLLPQLMILGIRFLSSTPDDDVEGQLLHTPIMTHATLPELRCLAFTGDSAYLEALLTHITSPPLESFQIMFVNEPTNPLPHLQQFMNTEQLRLTSATLRFNETLVFLGVYPREWRGLEPCLMAVRCRHLDLQVASLAQISNTLRAVVSAVEYLTIEYSRSPIWWSDWQDGLDRAQWRELLRPFSNVTTLSVPKDLIGELSRSLQSKDGESPMELFPKLKELSYPAGDGSVAGDAFTAFADDRQNAGHPFALVRRPGCWI
jgi:hypothetical protein